MFFQASKRRYGTARGKNKKRNHRNVITKGENRISELAGNHHIWCVVHGNTKELLSVVCMWHDHGDLFSALLSLLWRFERIRNSLGRNQRQVQRTLTIIYLLSYCLLQNEHNDYFCVTNDGETFILCTYNLLHLSWLKV